MRHRFVNMERNVLLAKSTLLDPRFNNGASHGEQYLVQEMASLLPEAEDVATPLPKSDTLWQALDAKVADREMQGKVWLIVYLRVGSILKIS